MNIAVIIATSHKRFDTLIHRAIHSVITQNLKENLTIVVVDDNEKDCTHILQQYTDSINPAIPIQIIRNTRTKHHSGTGSWNSGAMYVLQKFLAHSRNNKYSTQYITDSKDYAKILFNTSSLPHYYLAFLDDDDSWEKEYLQEVFNTIQDSIQQNNGKNKVALVAAGISFITQNNNKLLLPTEELLTKEKIFMQNPNIQGSSLFINLATFFFIGGFDESLKSTTDRDLLIRYVEYQKAYNLQTLFIPKPLVNYYHEDSSVTQNTESKSKGLTTFYRKYILEHSHEILEQSLHRAKRLFSYDNIIPIKDTKTSNFSNLNTIQDSQSKISSNYEIQAIRLMLGVISYDMDNLKRFLESFFALQPQKSSFLQSFMIIIISAKEYKKDYEEFYARLHKEQRQFLHCQWLETPQPIAQSRTELQEALYKKGSIEYGEDFIAWILDDDCEFYGIVNQEVYNIDYFYHIARHSHTDIDICISKNCGEAPLPFFSLLRTQLLDLYFACKRFNAKTGLLQYYKALDSKDYHFQESYYDYSSKDYRHLEYPFYSEIPLKKHITNLKQGIMGTRQLEIQEDIGRIKNISLHRGGNTIIYNPQALKVRNFTLEENYNRRSDFNWAIINTYMYDRKICEIVLPLTHKRQQKKLDYKSEIQKFQKDFLGSNFYRIFQNIVRHYKQGVPLTPQEILCQYEDIMLERKIKMYATLCRITTLHKQIQKEIPFHYKQSYRDIDDIITVFLKDMKLFLAKPHQFTDKTIETIYHYLKSLS